MEEQKEALLFEVIRQNFWSRAVPKPDMRYCEKLQNLLQAFAKAQFLIHLC